MDITGISPGIYTANSSGSGVAAAYYLCFPGEATYTQALLYDPATSNPVPVDLGAPTDRVYLSLYGTGFRLSRTVTASVGSVDVPVAGFAAVPQYQGLDVVNIGPLPRSLAGSGEVPIVLTFDTRFANGATVSIR
jgi:uncharacterized protein (TIGR03437 family)